jgi:hypothetical protein
VLSFAARGDEDRVLAHAQLVTHVRLVDPAKKVATLTTETVVDR